MLKIEEHVSRIAETPLKTFTQLTNKKEITVLYKFDTPLFDKEFNVKEVQKFTLFQLNAVTSLNVIFAYYFSFSFRNFTLKDKYFVIRRPSSQNITNFSGVELVYQSLFINVYNSEDGACLISENGLNEVIISDIVRKPKKPK